MFIYKSSYDKFYKTLIVYLFFFPHPPSRMDEFFLFHPPSRMDEFFCFIHLFLQQFFLLVLLSL